MKRHANILPTEYSQNTKYPNELCNAHKFIVISVITNRNIVYKLLFDVVVIIMNKPNQRVKQNYNKGGEEFICL